MPFREVKGPYSDSRNATEGVPYRSSGVTSGLTPTARSPSPLIFVLSAVFFKVRAPPLPTTTLRVVQIVGNILIAAGRTISAGAAAAITGDER